MIDYHFCGESDHDKNAFVSVHGGLLPIDGTIRSLQRLTTLSRKRTSNSSERKGRPTLGRVTTSLTNSC